MKILQELLFPCNIFDEANAEIALTNRDILILKEGLKSLETSAVTSGLNRSYYELVHGKEMNLTSY